MKTFNWITIFVFVVTVSTTPSFATTYVAQFLNIPGNLPGVAYGISGLNIVGRTDGFSVGGQNDAIFWTDPSATAIDLNPTGFGYSGASGASATNQVGLGGLNNSPSHALLWSGTAASVVDLHPAGFDSSSANAVSGNSQVGSAVKDQGQTTHAMLWHGTAASAVDLNPTGFTNSTAYGVSGAIQAGSGSGPLTSNLNHALLWNGTANSAIDLHPAGYGYSEINATNDSTQGGYAAVGIGANSQGHAMIWHGTAASAVDLHPSRFSGTDVLAISIAGQAGSGFGDATGGHIHALYWDGSAASYIDLNDFLTVLSPAVFNSAATGISDNGIIVGWGIDTAGVTHAVAWFPVPEPASCGLVLVALFVALFSRRPVRNS